MKNKDIMASGDATGLSSSTAMIEVWKPSPVFGDRYQVSSEGRVRSASGIKSPHSDKDGYPTVNLHRNGERKAFNVHRLICRAFHGESVAPHREVAHIDGIRTNCRSVNLKWVSKIENCFHKKAHGTHMAGASHPSSKLSAEAVHEIRATPGVRRSLAEKFGVSVHAIDDVRRGKNWRSLPHHPTADRQERGPSGCAKPS